MKIVILLVFLLGLIAIATPANSSSLVDLAPNITEEIIYEYPDGRGGTIKCSRTACYRCARSGRCVKIIKKEPTD